MGQNKYVTIVEGDNAIHWMPLNITDHEAQRQYRVGKAREWRRAFAKIPNFKSMNDDAIRKYHEKESADGQKIIELRKHQKDKRKKSAVK